MSAPITKSQMAFELPRLSYIDTRFEEPDVRSLPTPARASGWFAAFRAWREQSRALAELNSLTDRELSDAGLNRGDFSRMFDSRHNGDLMTRGHIV